MVSRIAVRHADKAYHVPSLPVQGCDATRFDFAVIRVGTNYQNAKRRRSLGGHWRESHKNFQKTPEGGKFGRSLR